MKILKYWGGTLPWTSPLQNYWGDMSLLSHRDRRPCIRLNGGDTAWQRADGLVSLQLVERK